MGIVTKDNYMPEMTLHHQIHLDGPMTVTGAQSVFVSMSARGDLKRAPAGYRTLNISCHTVTDPWFQMGEERYDEIKEAVEQEILQLLRNKLPGFEESGVVEHFGATQITWENWVYRYQGRVGGIPQSMSRSLLDWAPTQTPFPGLYLCGDTVYPGQGIPGVTLGGINVYYRSADYRNVLRTKR
jgi:phytoene dehydrogenase-like protein